jgi:hypothetical protein
VSAFDIVTTTLDVGERSAPTVSTDSFGDYVLADVLLDTSDLNIRGRHGILLF